MHRVSLFSGLSAAAAIWIIFSPVGLGYHDITAAVLNNVCVGLAIALLALPSAFLPDRQRGLSWCNSLLAFWLAVSPFILSYSQRRGTTQLALPMWNDVLFGCIIWFLSYLSGIYAPRLEEVE